MGRVTLEIFTAAYRKVVTKTYPPTSAGTVLTLDLVDDWGKPLGNGLYYLRVTTPSGKSTTILIVAR